MHVPSHLQEIARRLALRDWAAGRDFPREHYFGTIDGGRAILARHRNQESSEVRDELVVNVIAAALDEEGLLMTRVLDTATYSLQGDNPDLLWLRVCQACGWVVLQAYERACKAGEWPRD